MTPMKAIRAKCLDCCCWQEYEVRLCPSENCSLHPYRFGKNPARAGIGNKRASFPRNTNSTHDSGGVNGAKIDCTITPPNTEKTEASPMIFTKGAHP